MLELGKLYLPTALDYKFESNKVTFRIPELFSEEYIYDLPCSLQLIFSDSFVTIDYYGENETFLSDLLGLSDQHIAEGNLKHESFGKIQERALKVLSSYIDEAQQELFELFKNSKD
jgi:hypothetical protein